MNNKKTLMIFEEGRDAWNEWATEKLAEKDKYIHQGIWEEMQSKWENETKIFLVRNVGNGDCSFKKYIFPGEVIIKQDFIESRSYSFLSFECCKFYGRFLCENIIFKYNATFSGSFFYSDINLEHITFLQNADFSHVRFANSTNTPDQKHHHDGVFEKVIFEKGANFSSSEVSTSLVLRFCTFKDVSNFGKIKKFQQFDEIFKISLNGSVFEEGVIFRGSIFDFLALRGTKFFSYIDKENTTLNVPPKLDQVSFHKTPDLNSLKITDAKKLRKNIKKNPYHYRKYKDPYQNDYRDLKNLAIEVKDHEAEQHFSAQEMIARRHIEYCWYPKKKDPFRFPWFDFGGMVNFWVSLAYSFFSNYGQSIARPILGCIILLTLSFLSYFSLDWKNEVTERQWSFSYSAGKQEICYGQQDQRYQHAFRLAIKNAIPPIRVIGADSLKHSYACLYGTKPDPLFAESSTAGEQLGARRLVPNTPKAVYIVEGVQIILSSIFIFLALLAIRWKFRIR